MDKQKLLFLQVQSPQKTVLYYTNIVNCICIAKLSRVLFQKEKNIAKLHIAAIGHNLARSLRDNLHMVWDGELVSGEERQISPATWFGAIDCPSSLRNVSCTICIHQFGIQNKIQAINGKQGWNGREERDAVKGWIWDLGLTEHLMRDHSPSTERMKSPNDM
jgi:hypothetical protein